MTDEIFMSEKVKTFNRRWTRICTDGRGSVLWHGGAGKIKEADARGLKSGGHQRLPGDASGTRPWKFVDEAKAKRPVQRLGFAWRISAGERRRVTFGSAKHRSISEWRVIRTEQPKPLEAVLSLLARRGFVLSRFAAVEWSLMPDQLSSSAAQRIR